MRPPSFSRRCARPCEGRSHMSLHRPTFFPLAYADLRRLRTWHIKLDAIRRGV